MLLSKSKHKHSQKPNVSGIIREEMDMTRPIEFLIFVSLKQKSIYVL